MTGTSYRRVLVLAVAHCAVVVWACAGGERREAAPGSGPSEPPRAPATAVAVAPPEAATGPVAAPQLFGAPLDPGTPELTLAQLVAAPTAHAGKVVRTHGKIARVCQRMGCWMELQAEDTPGAVRIPMADHAFFLPQTVVGRSAEIEGKVSVAALSEAHKRHLESEGARATEANLSIAATGVYVR